jgi:hypothetical protein
MSILPAARRVSVGHIDKFRRASIGMPRYGVLAIGARCPYQGGCSTEIYLIGNDHPGPRRKVGIGATGGIGHDQFLDSGSREKTNSCGHFTGASAFVKMCSPLRKNDRRTADFIDHETPKMSFHGRSWNFANVRVSDDAIAVHIADETVEPRAENDGSMRLPFAHALEGEILHNGLSRGNWRG